MKKYLLAFMITLFIFPSLSYSLPWNVGDYVKTELLVGVGSGFGTAGGLFRITNTATSAVISTFCIELDEAIGHYVADVSDDTAIRGGRNTDSGDKLSKETKWLYWRFTEGDPFDVRALQLAIWWLEEEYYDKGSLDDWVSWYDSLPLPDLASVAKNYILLAQGQTPSADIRVLDISFDKRGQLPAQSFIIKVPEPGLLILLSIGIAGVGILARRYRKK